MYKRSFLIMALVAISFQHVDAGWRELWPLNKVVESKPAPQPPQPASWFSLSKNLSMDRVLKFAQNNHITPTRALAGLTGAGVLVWYRKPIANAVSDVASTTKEMYEAHSELYKNLAKLGLLGFAGVFMHKNGFDAEIYKYVQQPGFIRGVAVGSLATSLFANLMYGQTLREFMDLKNSYMAQAEDKKE